MAEVARRESRSAREYAALFPRIPGDPHQALRYQPDEVETFISTIRELQHYWLELVTLLPDGDSV